MIRRVHAVLRYRDLDEGGGASGRKRTPMQWFESSPLKVCAQCGAVLFAAEWAEHLSDRHVRNFWSCDECGYQFETTVYLPAGGEARDASQRATL